MHFGFAYAMKYLLISSAFATLGSMYTLKPLKRSIRGYREGERRKVKEGGGKEWRRGE